MNQKSIFSKAKKLMSIAEKVSKEKGIYHGVGVRAGVRELTILFWVWCCKRFESPKSFTFRGNTYHYFWHPYNTTWRGERAIEVPIIWELVKTYRGKEILEIGNVLSHYFPVNHDILDKYEEVNGVVNQDVIDFQPSKKYDLIVSISTLEHVGWDENLREPMKILPSLENLKRCLSPGGKIVVTLPLGYNSEIDTLLNEGKIQFTKIYCLKRISDDNKWTEVDWKDVQNATYNYSVSHANGLIIGIIQKE